MGRRPLDKCRVEEGGGGLRRITSVGAPKDKWTNVQRNVNKCGKDSARGGSATRGNPGSARKEKQQEETRGERSVAERARAGTELGI
eukprot:5107318-Pyramimonas_sp.AAC.1